MAATSAGALKAFLEAQGLGVSVYRDRPPAEATEPYITVTEAISVVPELAFSQFDDSQGHVAEQAQVDVWQRWKDPEDNSIEESYTLADAVYLALLGCRLSAAPTQVSGVQVVNRIRLFENETNIVHDAITVAIHRVLQRIA